MAKAIKSYRDLRVYQLALRDDYDHIGGMLSKMMEMMDNPEVWCKQYAKR